MFFSEKISYCNNGNIKKGIIWGEHRMNTKINIFSYVVSTAVLTLTITIEPIVQGHLAPNTGLFDQLLPKHRKTIRAAFKKRTDNNKDSHILVIHNIKQFKNIVLRNSFTKPVVLQCYYQDMNSKKTIGTPTPRIFHEVLQEVADMFDKRVFFAQMNIGENHDDFLRILAFHNVINDEKVTQKNTKLDLPLIMFYHNGQPIDPLFQGEQHKEYIANAIQTTFFAQPTIK